MKKKHYTFLYIPNSNSAPKTLEIPKLLVYLILSFILVFGASLGFVLMKYSSKIRDTYKLAAVEKENEVLRTNIDDLQVQVANLSVQISQNFDFQKRARLLANLDELSDDVGAVGVGGPEFAYVRSLSVLDDASKQSIQSLRSDIDMLLRQAKLQKDSYREIVASLSDEKERLNCTPSIKPLVHGYISSRFGKRMDPFTGRLSRHLGVDFSVSLGAPIYASADGIVTYARRWSSFGNVVEISHGFGFVTRYAHVSKIFVKKGQRVKRGDIIARVGSSGRSTASHLHYEVIHNGIHENPLSFILSDSEIVD